MALKCRVCTANAAASARFCSQCGAPLQAPCAACGCANPVGQQFCIECGFRLPTAEPKPDLWLSRAERRYVTVVFCDISGFTAMSTRLDPEDLRDVISGYQSRVLASVQAFGGFVARYVGDGVLIYFGWPEATETDAERAVRSALAIIAAFRTTPVGHHLVYVRLGIATGLVVVGEPIGQGDARQQTAVGATPNRAARLQALAEPNTVCIDGETRDRTGGLFDCSEIGPTSLKGFESPVSVWRVDREANVASRFAALRIHARTALIGREKELGVLAADWQQAVAGEGHVVLITGEAGIGKSRLVVEAEEQLPGNRSGVVNCFCSPNHQDDPLYPVVTQLSLQTGVERGDTPPTRFHKLEAMLADLERREDLPLLAELLSVDSAGLYEPVTGSPQQKKERTLQALIRWLRRLSQGQPVLFTFEDAHWADPSSLDLLEVLISHLDKMPVLLIVTARPEFTPRWLSRRGVMSLMLDRFDERDTIGLITRLAADRCLPPVLVKQIAEQSEGVPLYIEELTRTVLASCSQGGDAEAFGRLAVPDTLQASMIARLDRSPDAKNIAQIAAVIGREFSQGLLLAIAPMPEPAVLRGLQELTAAGLAVRWGQTAEATYAFRHVLLRDAAYGMLLRERRRDLHGRVVFALEQYFVDIAVQQPNTLAQHCELAGDNGKAVRYWQNASRRSIAQGALIEAASQLRRALGLLAGLPDDDWRDRQEIEMQTSLGGVLFASVGWEEAQQCYERARLLGQVLKDPSVLAPVLSGQFTSFIGEAKYDLAYQVARDLEQLSEQSDDNRIRLMAARSMGVWCHWMGHFARSAEHCERVVSLYTPGVHSRLATVIGFDMRTQAQINSALDLLLLGFPGRACERLRLGLEQTRSLGHQHSLAYALVYGAIFMQILPDLAAAETMLDEAEALSKKQGYPHWLALVTVVRGPLAAGRGDARGVLARARQGFEQYASTFPSYIRGGSVLNQHYYFGQLARICEQAEAHDEALGYLNSAIGALEQEAGEQWYGAELYRLRGELLSRRGTARSKEAEADFRRAVALAQSQSARFWELRALVALCRSLAGTSEADVTRSLLASRRAWFGDEPVLADLQDADRLLQPAGQKMR